MKSDRATAKLLALASTMTVAVGLAMVSGTASAAPTNSSHAAAAREQAVVSLVGTSAVIVPGVHVQSLLSALHTEIVDGTDRELTALAQAPGVLGLSLNVTAHLEDFGWGGPGFHPGPTPGPTPGHNGGNGNGGSGSSGSSGGNGNGGSSGGSGHSSPTPTPAPPEGVLAPSTIGGTAGTPNAGKGVTVALIDTGVTDTAALNRASGRLVDAVDTSGLNNDNGQVLDHGTFTDGYGHGTFMASLIAGGKVAGSGDLGIGVASGATIDVVKVADDQGNTSLAALLAGLNWVATHADTVDVANLSLAVDRPSKSYGVDPLNYAVTMTRSSGVTVVVAAGNTPGVVGDPGFDAAALTVGAADTTGNKPTVASFSGYDNVNGVTKPDVVAAGVNVLGVMPTSALISQQNPAARQPSGLFRGSGTSQSTAIVSGLAAIYLQSHQRSNPLTVKAAIRDAAVGIPGSRTDGQGLVAIPTGSNYSTRDAGELGYNSSSWFQTSSQWGNLFNGGAFDSRRWNARLWNARLWGSRLWAGVDFDSRLWGSRLWNSRLWGSRLWGSRLWAATYWGDPS